MSTANITTPTPAQSYPLSIRNSSRQITENFDDDTEERDAFLQYLIVKQPNYQQHQQQTSRKSNTNFTTSIGSIIDRTPTNLFELKQQRLLAAADRKKRIIARIVSIVGLLIILLCAAIVTLTLKMAPKIDELVRTKVGAHQLVHIITRMNTSVTTTTATLATTRQDNYTINGSITEKFILRTRQKLFP
ncbi:unnamed protein product [Rotaria sp. Silwood1]|nr:unnamed protein product [Rotaria sp. Silwood1]CAF3327951.1 unnamed protein product [Rotaria sp. Silwood1]CAF3335870.1 unnamed protein product [Rotaria sp. Silwood1]CAF3346530.1 unnamed protein product [Rotaria sp. Silwood1]CAF3359880.1 unnamed protein product [Rotaria sp. Silwood1]